MNDERWLSRTGDSLLTWTDSNMPCPALWPVLIGTEPLTWAPSYRVHCCCSALQQPLPLALLQGYQMGKTKVFLRAGQMAVLDKLRTELMNRSATTIQRHVKGFTARRRYQRTHRAAITLQVCNIVTSSWCSGTLQEHHMSVTLHAACLVMLSRLGGAGR